MFHLYIIISIFIIILIMILIPSTLIWPPVYINVLLVIFTTGGPLVVELARVDASEDLFVFQLKTGTILINVKLSKLSINWIFSAINQSFVSLEMCHKRFLINPEICPA